jgi:hypothetical protein
MGGDFGRAGAKLQLAGDNYPRAVNLIDGAQVREFHPTAQPAAPTPHAHAHAALSLSA